MAGVLPSCICAYQIVSVFGGAGGCVGVCGDYIFFLVGGWEGE